MSRFLTQIVLLGGIAAGALLSSSVRDVERRMPALAPAPSGPSLQVIQIDGYPLDRSFKGLVSYPKLDAVLVLEEVRLGRAHWTTPDGAAPSYIAQNRPPNLEEMRRADLIVTPVKATIAQVLRGASYREGDSVVFDVAGGQVWTVKFQAEAEIAPDLDRLTDGSRIMVAGEVRKEGLVPSFVYALDATGRGARSLLTSASREPAAFGMGRLQAALAARP